MKKVLDWLFSLKEFLIFIAVCVIFGKFSIFIRYQNIGLTVLLVLSVACAIFFRKSLGNEKEKEDE